MMTDFVYFGGAEGDRTPDPKTASLVLSQLSYSPVFPANARVNVTSHSGVVKKKPVISSHCIRPPSV